jgi:hypothetical protein
MISGRIATPVSLRSDFIHITGMAIHIPPESTIHINGIGNIANSILVTIFFVQ